MPKFQAVKQLCEDVRRLTLDIGELIASDSFELCNDLLANRQCKLESLIDALSLCDEKHASELVRDTLEWIQKQDAPNIEQIACKHALSKKSIQKHRKTKIAIQAYSSASK